MIDNPNFIDLISQISNGERTGRMRVCTRVDGKLSFATLFFNGGQLSNCEYIGKSGDFAVAALINAQIVTVVFVSGDGSDYVRDPAIRSIDDLLSSVGHQISAKTESSIKPTELKIIATDALKSICGDSAIKLVYDLAISYPPEKDHNKFVEECVKLAANLVGSDMAKDILKPLLETQK